MPFVVKAAPVPDAGVGSLSFDEKTMYRGKEVSVGDEDFVFASDHQAHCLRAAVVPVNRQLAERASWKVVTPDGLTGMIGKRILAGITYLDDAGEVVNRLEIVGTVQSVEPLVAIHRGDDADPFTLPPEPDAFEPAPPGDYRLRSTGEVIVDPDYLTTWTVRPSDD
jgi:hypothetical protein